MAVKHIKYPDVMKRSPEIPNVSWQALSKISESELIIDNSAAGVLGSGANGAVRRGTWNGTPVAVKSLAPQSGDEASRRSFFQEMQALDALTHPNIVQFYGSCGHGDGRVSFVMELVSGGTLSARCVSGPLPLREVVRALIDLARALVYAHARGITQCVDT